MREGQGKREFPVIWAFLGLTILVTLIFYRDFIFHPGRLLAGSDMLLEGYPLRKFFVDEITAGRGVPLWTPHVYAGMPYVALLPGPIFYPTTLLYFVMPLYRAIGWTFVLHTFLAGALAYFMARSFRLRPWAAAVCGSSFMLTGYVTSHLLGGQDGRMFAMTLMPLAFGMLERGLRTGRVRWYCGLSLAVGLQIFTPHTQIVYFSSLALSLYLVFHLVARVGTASRSPAWVAYAKPIGSFALSFGVAAGIGAIQLLPTFALLDHATRAATEQGYAFAASWSLPPQELTALLLPDFIGSLNRYWGANLLKLHTEYLGAVPVALAMLALAASFKPTLTRGQRKTIWFLWGASVLAVLFALGAVTPVHRIAYTMLPMISSFRAPAMMMCAVAMFIPLLAGFGWEAMLAHRDGRAGSSDASPKAGGWPVSWFVLGVFGLPIALLGLAAAGNPEGLHRFARLAWFEPGWPKLPPAELAPFLRSGGLVLLAGFAVAWGIGLGVARRRLSELAVIAVIVFAIADAWRIDARYLPIGDAAAVSAVADDLVLATLREDAGPGERVWAYQTLYRPNRFMYDGVSSATGSQKFLLEPYARLIGGIRPDDGLIQHSNLIPFLGIKYLIVSQPISGLDLLAEEPGRFLYEIPVPPHAFFPAEVASLRDTTEAVLRTRANPDPLALAVVEVEPGQAPPQAGQGSAEIVVYEPQDIELQVTAEQGGLLVVSEIYHPGWRAFVDDEEVPVWRTNVAFRGVEVPAGVHRVRFVYESAAFRAGTWLSGLSLMAVVLILVGSRWARRRPDSAPREAAHG